MRHHVTHLRAWRDGTLKSLLGVSSSRRLTVADYRAIMQLLPEIYWWDMPRLPWKAADHRKLDNRAVLKNDPIGIYWLYERGNF